MWFEIWLKGEKNLKKEGEQEQFVEPNVKGKKKRCKYICFGVEENHFREIENDRSNCCALYSNAALVETSHWDSMAILVTFFSQNTLFGP